MKKGIVTEGIQSHDSNSPPLYYRIPNALNKAVPPSTGSVQKDATQLHFSVPRLKPDSNPSPSA